METLILGCYVLVETDSVLLLTLFGALQFGGTLVAPAFGVAGDRIGHRNLLCGMRVFYTILSTTLMSIAFVGATNPTTALHLNRRNAWRMQWENSLHPLALHDAANRKCFA